MVVRSSSVAPDELRFVFWTSPKTPRAKLHARSRCPRIRGGDVCEVAVRADDLVGHPERVCGCAGAHRLLVGDQIDACVEPRLLFVVPQSFSGPLGSAFRPVLSSLEQYARLDVPTWARALATGQLFVAPAWLAAWLLAVKARCGVQRGQFADWIVVDLGAVPSQDPVDGGLLAVTVSGVLEALDRFSYDGLVEAVAVSRRLVGTGAMSSGSLQAPDAVLGGG